MSEVGSHVQRGRRARGGPPSGPQFDLTSDDAKPGRVPPHDLDAEAAVLSCFLLEPDRLNDVEKLRQEHFYSPANRRIFEAIRALDNEKQRIDSVTVASWLKSRGRLAEIGGVPYLARIVDAAPAVANVAQYAGTVIEKQRVRSVIAASQTIAAEGYGDVGNVQDWIQASEQIIFNLAHNEQADEMESVRDGVRALMARQRDAADRGSTILGMATGFTAFDELTSGLHPGELAIVAARPGMGKTSWALNIAVNVASPKMEKGEEIPGHAVCVFSLEMPKDQVTMRMVCAEGRVPIGDFRRNCLNQGAMFDLTKAAQFLASLPIWVDDTPAITLQELRAKVRRKLRECADRGIKLGLIVIDYLQLMGSSPGSRASNRQEEVAEVSKGLKQLAKEMGCPVIALSQLNRALEARAGGKRPQLSDLRESGAIEQDADLVIFIHRDDYYDKQSNLQGYAEILVEKQRNGPLGSEWITWESKSTRFDNCSSEDHFKIREAIDARIARAKGSRKGGAEWGD